MVTCYIGLGSNLQQPAQQVRQALHELATIPDCRLLAQSSLYRSPPLGPQDQPDFINAVAAIETSLSPHALLDALQAIEQTHQRQRTRHWGPRTLDLDLLLYGDQEINDTRLQLPHPGLRQRAFVLYPLDEIAPRLQVPGLGPLSELLRAVPAQGLHRIEDGQGKPRAKPLQ